ncbi:MAG TPA: YciI family protein [Terriglobales bacterium]|nr:YciI family protein [Terriglobales bacterium]
MKYILLMSGTRAGVDTYHAWSAEDIEAHMAVLQGIQKELTKTGEFVATQGLAEPAEAKVVRGEKNGLPVTDGIFPESKEFLLGYWIVDVATPERAYALAGRISAAPGPAGAPTNMPIEVRQFATYQPTSPSTDVEKCNVGSD